MMGRLVTAAMLLTTAACVTYGDGSASDNARCNADNARSLIGQQASSALGAEALQRTGANGLRWIQPGTAVTMDYRPDRLNIKLDAANRVEAFTCG